MRVQGQWLGKFCGGLMGLLLTQHWAGVLIGLFLGHAYDLYRTQVQFLDDAVRFKKGWQSNQGQSESLQSGFMQTLFFVLGKLAKCDGRVSEAEIAWVEQLMQRLYLNPQQRKEAIRYFNQGKQPEVDVEPLLKDFAQFAVPFGLNALFLELMVECALADGKLHPAEKSMLLTCAERLKLPAARVDDFVRRFSQGGFRQSAGYSAGGQGGFGAGSAHSGGGYAGGDYASGYSSGFHGGANSGATGGGGQSYGQGRQRGGGATRSDELALAYDTLGVKPSASKAEIKRAYRKLMSKHHPDKLMSRGAPEVMLNLAKEKTQSIQKAFEIISKARGFR